MGQAPAVLWTRRTADVFGHAAGYVEAQRVVALAQVGAALAASRTKF